MKEKLETAISDAVQALFAVHLTIELTRPEEQFGDYATNVALQLSKQLGKNPREIAEALAVKLREALAEQIREVTVAGPGFINLILSDEALAQSLQAKPIQSLAGQTIVAEYSDPNPFKVLHAGHLYTSVVGDAIANLLAGAGGTVHRVNFGGDVGLHVAKTIWAILFYETKGNTSDEELALLKTKTYRDKSLETRAAWLANNYMRGTADYEEDNEDAKMQIVALNKRIYQIHTDNDHDSPLAQIYWLGREWSYAYFDSFYKHIGTSFEKYYPESETAPLGLQTVRDHVGTVYEESNGAVIFDGEKYGLHTRVFINSEGLPTYEAKDVGLIMKKWQDYHFDQSIVITGNDIIEYMKVVLKSIEQFKPELSSRSRHLTHGIVKLTGGTKMSSRKGNILRATDVLSAAHEANQALTGQGNQETVLGAVKYAFLKNRMGGDIIYDPQESVSLEGNSGPYLQYAHARARSILSKADAPAQDDTFSDKLALEAGERSLARKISEYTEAVDKATAELMPHHICAYLYELAQTFNRFYEHNRVIGDERQAVRLSLVRRYADTLKAGLAILGIASPNKM
ncbi:MAG TPA: arginine--tRNA ligase [Verrucomicrobiae bacterium]|jgi:arginyl-tRNA synthetase|nr:arginine--tRNA ligase [Verrucomicrobiae bacterium]